MAAGSEQLQRSALQHGSGMALPTLPAAHPLTALSNPPSPSTTPRYPKNDSTANAWLVNYLTDFHTALFGADWLDAKAGYSPFVDQSSWINYFLTVEASKNPDGYRWARERGSGRFLCRPHGRRRVLGRGKEGPDRAPAPGWSQRPGRSPVLGVLKLLPRCPPRPPRGSTYMHKDADKPLAMGPAWDYNEAFGICCGFPVEGYDDNGISAPGVAGGSAISPNGWRFLICADQERCVFDPVDGISSWFRRVWNDTAYRAAADARFKELRAAGWSDTAVESVLQSAATEARRGWDAACFRGGERGVREREAACMGVPVGACVCAFAAKKNPVGSEAPPTAPSRSHSTPRADRAGHHP